MLRTSSPTDLLNILQSLINAADEYEIDGVESVRDEMNLSNSFVSKKSTDVGYLTSGGAKKGGGNTKKGVKANKSSDYLTLDAKKAFNHLRYAFT